MGPERPAPPLPHFEWMDLGPEYYYGSKRVQYSNWVQAMEGDIDQSHNAFVHSQLHLPELAPGERPSVAQVRAFDKHPRFETVDTDVGFVIGAVRGTPEPDTNYTRITQWMGPFFTMTGVTGHNPNRPWRAWVPIDDYTTYVIGVSFHPLNKLTPEQQRERRGGVFNISPEMREPKTSKPFGAWRPIPSLENDFFQDREAQKNETFAGISEFWAQDAAPQLSMGYIFQRQYEHLGTTDRAIIRARNWLIKNAKRLRDEGVAPDNVWNPEGYMKRSGGKFHKIDEWWFAATEEDRKAIPGTNPDASV
jgi:hypothetical protein